MSDCPKAEADDRRLGEAGETHVLRLLRERLPGTVRNGHQYAKFDYRHAGSHTDIELKTRRCQITSFPSFFVDQDKIRRGRLRQELGASERTIYLFLFEPLGWSGAGEVWGWIDDGRELATVYSANSRRPGIMDKKLACIPRDLLTPLENLLPVPATLPSPIPEEIEIDHENSVPLEVL